MRIWSSFRASGWFDVGGTSAAAPAWAGLVAIADQGLATVGSGTLSTGTPLNELYSLPSSDFHDLIGGSNGYSATAGYDLVTGLGTPRANLVVTGRVADAGSSGSSPGAATSNSGVTVISTSSGSPSSPTSTHTTHKHATKKTTHTKVTRTRATRTKVARSTTHGAKVATHTTGTAAARSVGLASASIAEGAILDTALEAMMESGD